MISQYIIGPKHATFYDLQACPQGSMPVFRLLCGPKTGFSPPGATNSTDKHGERWQISRLSVQKCGHTLPTIVNIWNFAHTVAPRGQHTVAPRGQFVCTIFFTKFSAFVRIYIAFIFLIWSPSWDRRPSYKHFPSMKTFSHKFSKATTSWI